MISTATKIKFKRSGVAGRRPSLADLQLGELGINYNDGKLFFRQENEVVGSRIIEPGQGDVIGKTIFVSVEGNDNNSGLNERDAKRTVKAAAAVAEPGDSIKLYPGQYIEDNPIVFKDRVSVEGMELRNVLVTPANPSKDLYQVGEAFHATNHSFVSNRDSRDGASIITFRPLEGTASDRYFDAARLIRDNLSFIANETVGFLTSGYSGFAAGQRSQDAARALELNKNFIVEEAFQYINSPDYTGAAYFNPDPAQCKRDLGNIIDGWRYDLISDGNTRSTGLGLTYYAPIPFVKSANVADLVYNRNNGDVLIETDVDTQVAVGEKIKLQDIRLECGSYNNDFLITGFKYDNTSGIGTVNLPFIHNVKVGDLVKFDGLEFDCPAYGAIEYGIQDFKYNETTGGSVVTLNKDHDLKIGDTIELRDLQFDCPAYGGDFTNIIGLEYNKTSGQGVITYDKPADLKSGDVVILYDLTLTCDAYGNAISVTDFSYDNFTGITEVEVNRPHNLRPGDLIKLENLKFSCDSYLNETYKVSNFVYNESTGNSVLTLTEPHSLVAGKNVKLADLVFSCNSYVPTAKAISDFQYDEVVGISTITLASPHNLSVGDQFRLEDLVFSCNSYSFTDIPIIDAPYDNVTGYVTLSFSGDHGQQVGGRVRLRDIEYSCPGGSGITTTLFPDGTFGYEFEILSVPNTKKMILNVGTSTIEHSYVSGGTATVGITTTVFPDGTQGFDFNVSSVNSPTVIEASVGISTIAHNYVSGGSLFVGFTTTVFPDGTQGDTFRVNSIPSSTQISVNVGVSSIAHTFVSGGTATDLDSFISVSGFTYNEGDGTGLVSLDKAHNLVVGDSFVLEDLKFNCNSYRTGGTSTIDITNFEYDKVTGLSTVTLSSSHNLHVNDTVALYDIKFSCPGGSGITTNIFPDGTRDNFYDVVADLNPNQIIVRVGKSDITHTYDSGGTLSVGITTNIFPDGTRPSGDFFQVISVPSTKSVLTQVGLSSIAHSYASGGKFYTGITTNVFPQVFTDPNIKVTNAVYDEVSGVITITTNKAHGLTATAPVLLQDLNFSCLSGGVGNTPGNLVFPRNQEVYDVVSVLSPTQYTINVGPSDFAHTYVDGGTSTTQNITKATYNKGTGDLTVTLDKQHGYSVGDRASVVDLLFSCQSGGPNNQPGTLLFPRPTDEYEVLSASGKTLTVNVGAFPSLVHTYKNGGSLTYSSTVLPVSNAVYDQSTGVLTLTTSIALGAPVGSTIKMQGLNFSCASGGPGNDSGSIVFPRLDTPNFRVKEVKSGVSYVINVGTSTLSHTYTSGGFSSLKKLKNDPNIFKVIATPTPSKVITNVGVSSIVHDYVSGGNMFVGITTNVFPDGTRPDGSRFEVISALSPNQALINIGVSSITHNYDSGGRMQYGTTNERPVLDFLYDGQTGISTVTIRGTHGLNQGDLVKLKGLEFSCTNSPGITTTIFPDGTAAGLNIYKVTEIVSNSTFKTNVGRVAFDHTYIQGGSAFVGITTNIFPDGTQGYNYTVAAIPNKNQVTVDVGISSIQHDYVRGGSLFSGRTNERDIADFKYDHISGDAVLTFRKAQNLFTQDLVKLKNLQFDCPNSTGITTTLFPDGTRSNLFLIKERLNPTQFKLNVGKSPFGHDYVRGTGQAFVGITTNIFPDTKTQPSKLFKVVDVPTPTTISAKIGVSTISHSYVKGGKVFVGINTDIFPGDEQVSPLGDTYTVQSITKDGELVINVGLSSISHSYGGGGKVLYGQSSGNNLQHITGPGVLDATIAAIDFEKQVAINALNNRPWGSFVPEETAVVEAFAYDNQTGFGTVTARGINVNTGDTIRMSDIQFVCSEEYAGVTTTFFPDNTRPEGQYFRVERRINIDEFEVNIGVSTIKHVFNYNTSGNVYRYRQSILDVNYDRSSGITSIRATKHGYKAKDIVELGDIEFDCPVFKPQYDIENFVYDNTTGLSTVTTTVDNTIKVGDNVKLADIKLECPPYGNQRVIDNFVYDNKSGLSTISLTQAHGLNLRPRPSVSISTALYDNQTGILTVTTNADINFTDRSGQGVQLSGLRFSCDSAGFPGTLTYPEENLVYDILEIQSPSKFKINVGLSTIAHEYVNGGAATKVDRFDVKLQGIKFDCPAYGNTIDVTNFLYDNRSGNSLVTVDRAHKLSVGDDIKLADLKFQCAPYGNNYNVLNADYDNTTGIITVTTNQNINGVGVGDTIRLSRLQFDCVGSGPEYNITNVFFNTGNRSVILTIPELPVGLNPGDDIKLANMSYLEGGSGNVVQYPDGRDSSLNIFRINDVQPNSILPGYYDVTTAFANVKDPFAIFNNTGKLTTGITTNIYPENVGAEGGFYEVIRLRQDNQFEIQVGTSTITHNYVRQGQMFTGVTTNFFPGNLQNSPRGNIFEIVEVPTPTQVRINVGVSSISHSYDSGGQMFVGITTNIFPDGTRGNLFPVVGVANTLTLRIDAGVSSIPHNYVSGGELFVGITTNIFPGNSQNSPRGSIFKVLSKDNECGSDRFTINVGVSSITHSYVEGGTVTTGVTTNKFPDGTHGFKFPVIDVLDDNYFTVNVGTSTITHNYISGGFTRRLEVPINSFVYDRVSGLSTVGIQSHRMNIGDLVKIRDVKFNCDAYGGEKGISGVVYDNTTGRMTVNTSSAHSLNINDVVKLSNIQMDCSPYGNERTITSATYNRNNGNLSVQVSEPHNLKISENVKLKGLEFSCSSEHAGVTTTIFPDSTAPSLNIYAIESITNATTFMVNVGTSTISHNYVSGGSAFVGITTNIFPGDSQNSPRGSFLSVVDIPASDAFVVNVGVSTISHGYVRGGLVQTGITTDVFPDGTQSDFFKIEEVPTNDTVVINAGISSIIHRYNSGGFAAKYVTYQSNNSQLLDSSVIRVSGDCQAVGERVEELAGIVTSIIKNGPSIAPGGIPVDVVSASYDQSGGALSVTVKEAIDLAPTNIVRIEGLIFECESSGVTNTRVYPDNKVFNYEVLSVQSPTTFTINVGSKADIPHTYVNGGTVRPGNKFDVATATYNTENGIVRVTTTEDNYLVLGRGVNLQGLNFSCTSGGPNNKPGTLTFPDKTPTNVTAATYDSVTGVLRITTNRPHQAYKDAFVSLNGLTFTCDPGGPLVFPRNPDTKSFRVTKRVDDYTYECQLAPTNKVHTYLSGGTSSTGNGNFRVSRLIDTKTFEVTMVPLDLPHTYVNGGSAASVFTRQIIDGININTRKCARDVRRIYLAVAHDITRGGNWKCVEGAKLYYDNVGQTKFISGGEVNQTVEALDFSLNVVRCLINNVTWGGVPRGYLTKGERSELRLPTSAKTSVVGFRQQLLSNQYTTEKKSISGMVYDNLTGIATVTTKLSHELVKYDGIQLSDIEMRCTGSPRITTNVFPDGTQGEIFEVMETLDDRVEYIVTDASYTNTTGKLVVTTTGNNDIPVGSRAKLDGLLWTCSYDPSKQLKFPENRKFRYEVIAKPDGTTLEFNVGISTIPHTFVPAPVDVEYTVKEDPVKFKVHVGTVSFPHTYFGGGTVWHKLPFTPPFTQTQIKDVSQQKDPIQLTNNTPNGCANVFSAISNCIGVVTSIVANGLEGSGISTTYPGNDGKGVPTMAEMPSQGVGNIIKGPYIRNCTNFVPKSIGMRMDGFDAEPGDEISNGVQGSSNVDSFTQFNPGGVGCSISNGTYQQLVSIFTICCDEAIVCDSGAQLDLTNSNSSFGRLGLVARGIGDKLSKCIDRYTGIVAKEASIEDDLVVVKGIGDKRPYDGQGIFFGELFRDVVSIEVLDGGSGYNDDIPPNAFVAEPTGPAGIKAEVSPTVRDGVVVSIEVIANGNQYREKFPEVTISPPKSPLGRTAKARAITEPLYYNVESSSPPEEGTTSIIFKQRLNNTVSVGTTVFFSRLSLQIASSHSFEYIGAGNSINGARPSEGGVPIKENEIVKEDGGSIVYTSTDQAGNFNIGDDFVINQFTGTITGRSFDQSVLNKVTPLIIALDS